MATRVRLCLVVAVVPWLGACLTTFVWAALQGQSTIDQVVRDFVRIPFFLCPIVGFGITLLLAALIERAIGRGTATRSVAFGWLAGTGAFMAVALIAASGGGYLMWLALYWSFLSGYLPFTVLFGAWAVYRGRPHRWPGGASVA